MRGTGASLLPVFRLRHSWIKILGPRGGKVALWAGEAAPISGSELRPVLEILCTLGQARGGRACRGWLHCGRSLPCLFSAVSLAQFEFRLGFPVGCSVIFWVHEVGVEPGTSPTFRLKLPTRPSDATVSWRNLSLLRVEWSHHILSLSLQRVQPEDPSLRVLTD